MFNELKMSILINTALGILTMPSVTRQGDVRLWAPEQRTHHDYGFFPALPLYRMHV